MKYLNLENCKFYLGSELMEKIKAYMQNVGKIELDPKFDGKQMIMVIQPI